MAVRTAEAEWRGALRDGEGTLRTTSGSFSGPYSYPSRFEEGPGTNPEELIGAAHAGCFSMALAGVLANAGHPPRRISTRADVHLDKGAAGFEITRVVLRTEVEAPGLADEAFQRHAEAAKQNCPVSKALKGGPRIELEARLT